MEREIKDLVTSSGKKFAIKAYLTFSEFEPTTLIEDTLKRSAKLIELCLVSLEGVAENAYTRARELPVADYTDIAKEVAKAINGNFPTEK